jgi:ribosomal-protein-alanine N-acetyltransferase
VSTRPATRPVTEDDAEALARLVAADRDFLAPWEPLHEDDWYTVEGQREAVRAALERARSGQGLPRVVLDEGGRVAGRITLSDITRGPFQSCHVGYWVASARNGRGLATAAVREVVDLAFTRLGLHRVQAATLLHNAASQAVLRRAGFTPIGVAPQYLRIAGRWQDHLLFQVVAPAAG